MTPKMVTVQMTVTATPMTTMDVLLRDDVLSALETGHWISSEIPSCMSLLG